jgi:UDP-N-acetylglucosamine 3-dehydrogenase
MADRMRVAMVGCGAIAERLHVPDYATTPEAEIVALCDRSKEKAEELAAKWAPEARIYTDWKKMFAKEAIDCCTIALPNSIHCGATLDALKAGCNVLVEKPMAASAAEAKRMVAAAKKTKKLLMVNQCQRLAGPHLKAKEVLDSGILGKILYVTAMFGHGGPDEWSPDSKWFFRKKDARFGAMADLGVHKADLIRFLAGKEIAEIAAHTARLEKGGSVEDNFTSSFKFTDGTVGTLGASWTIYGLGANYILFHCENGSLFVGWDPKRPVFAGLKNPECEIVFEPVAPIEKYEDTWGLDVSGRFVRACMGLEKPFCTGEDGAKSLDVILAAEKSAQTGRAVQIKH